MTDRRYYGPRRRHIKGIPCRYWYVIEYDRTTRKRRWLSTGLEDLALAHKWLEARRIDAVVHPLAKARPSKLFGEAAQEWFQDMNLRLRPASMSTISHAIRSWGPLNSTVLADLTTEQVRRFLQPYHAKSPVTFNNEHIRLGWFLNWARRQGYIEQSPLASISPRPVPRKTTRILSVDEETLLLNATTNPRFQALVVTAIETGLRRRALLEMRWEHIDADGWLRLPADLLKSNRELHVPLSERCSSVLKALRTTVIGLVFDLSETAVSTQWRRACKRAGITSLKFHDLRRTFLTRLRQRGVPMDVAMRLSDHVDLKTVLECYRAISVGELEKAIGRRPHETLSDSQA